MIHITDGATTSQPTPTKFDTQGSKISTDIVDTATYLVAADACSTRATDQLSPENSAETLANYEPHSTLTLSPTKPNQTDLNTETDAANVPTNNSEFLNVIFAELAEPLRPFVLGFAGKPKDCKAWGGEAWRTEKSVTDNPACNWYFSLAIYAPAEDGYHRREKDCAAVYGLMLDDLGTKALPLDRLDTRTCSR